MTITKIRNLDMTTSRAAAYTVARHMFQATELIRGIGVEWTTVIRPWNASHHHRPDANFEFLQYSYVQTLAVCLQWTFSVNHAIPLNTTNRGSSAHLLQYNCLDVLFHERVWWGPGFYTPFNIFASTDPPLSKTFRFCAGEVEFFPSQYFCKSLPSHIW